MINLTVIPGAINAANSGEPGGDSDISGGVANFDETAGKILDENEYNE